MGHLYIDGVLAYHTDPAKPIEPRGWTNEAQELERDYGMRFHEPVDRRTIRGVPIDGDGGALDSNNPDVATPPVTIEALLARAASLSWRVKVIEVEDRHGAFIWWADLYCPIRVSRKHGYGPTLGDALVNALDAEEVLHEVPFRSHEVAKVREHPKEATFVRRF